MHRFAAAARYRASLNCQTGACYPFVRDDAPRAASTIGKLVSIQLVKPSTRWLTSSPIAVSEYSTCGGTTGKDTRLTKPSSSSA
ncbi:conserved hypothetical protein [Ralstonia solanacearum Po82]|uniref:Uncharacterized protein n=1 Tax=Ralstonia solanacearum (strain Po82) TaxID=1031711 RepID=F6G6S3_RALS8|nr:conserved hypothetical protein [Ralstonia solanacearum Po82]